MMVVEGPSILLLLGFLLVQSWMLQLAQSFNNVTDQSALLAFKSQLSSGPNETVLAGNCSAGTNFCNWVGISCSRRRQRVTALELPYMGLQGTISPHIGNLSFLLSLDLSNNSFSGFLPHEITRLRRLRMLRLSSNLLEGRIPPLHECQKLQAIDLSSNHLVGAIPSTLGNLSSLEFLNLQFNSLNGALPFAIFNISSLTKLGLSNNQLSGTLPMDLCRHCPNLQGLYLTTNEFNGRLPSGMDYCKELVVLSIGYNKFDGSIPQGFGSLEKLKLLGLGGNNLTGKIPSSISNLSRLLALGIETNNIEGSIPGDLWHLPNLYGLNLATNDLTGTIPHSLFNISSLEEIFLSQNSLSGNLPFDPSLPCLNVKYMFFGMNKFSGPIPSHLSNCSNLVQVDFNGNLLSGPVPNTLGQLKYLEELFLNNNQLTGEPGHQKLNFLSSLSNCRFLKVLSISKNPLDVTLPSSIGNFSTFLHSIVASEAQLKGHIPVEIGSLKSLKWLSLQSNNLSGKIPSTIGELKRLQRLFLSNNKIEGFIPQDVCQLQNLGEIDLSMNKISGSIPNCIANLSLLQWLDLHSNSLESSIPLSLFTLENLRFLDLSLNSFGGYLFANMNSLDGMEHMDLSRNQITGNIPSIIGAFESLSFLDLSKNSFSGDIPESFGNLRGLETLNLSNNNLSGRIPKSLEALPFLKYLNLSFNELSGEIPSGGVFMNFTAESFSGNIALCGNPSFGVPPCQSPGSKGSKVKQILLKYFLPGISLFIILLSFVYTVRRYRGSNTPAPGLPTTLPALEHRMVSYLELCQGTNNFCESNLLGTGGFSSVYKGTLSDGTIVAVKVLNLQLSSAFKSFDTECKVLQTIRHRNLVKVISSCSNPEFRALVLQYIPNGNLERWLYSHNYCLNLLQRVNIMVDIASVLHYLHHGQSNPVVHCDLKPTNILLDEDMVAHVGDFGIAKILAQNKDATQTKTLGTLGYIAPEYGYEGKVSIKGDVYSFGIIVLEMVTRKKPTDDMFDGELTLRQWIIGSLPERMIEVVDEGLLRMEYRRGISTMESILSSIIELGLRCSEELPEERIDINDVLPKLTKIKSTLSGNRNMHA